MNNIRIIVYHPNLDLLSDRTLRQLLKKLSSLGREIQTQEVLTLVNDSSLSWPEKQSIRDRITPQLSHISAYYVEELYKDSLEVTLTFTAAALWLLQNTIGESVKEAWKKTEWHEMIVDYLSSDRLDTVKTYLYAALDNGYLIASWLTLSMKRPTSPVIWS
jgi:hypothetical protein